MKTTFLLTTVKNRAMRIPMAVVVAAATFLQHSATAIPTVDLGTASSFAVLAGSSVINTGPTVINGGNVGASPGSTITGFPPGSVVPPFTLHAGDAVAQQAQSDLTTAYNAAAGAAVTANLTGQDLGGLTLTPGVYFFSSSAQLTGGLILDALGNPDAEFIFQIGSALTTASASSVRSINGGLDPLCNVFWQVGSSATLGTSSTFEGHILALTSITLNNSVTLDGSALARNGVVTLDANTILNDDCKDHSSTSVPDTGSTLLLLSSGLGALFAFRRRIFSPA